MKISRRQAMRLCVAALSAGLSMSAWAWGEKPVRLLVPAPPGGTMDIVARSLAEQIASSIGQPVVVENKPGAGGAIAVQALLAAPADGQTIMLTANNVVTEIPHVMKPSFDPLKDLKPLAAVARASMVLVVNPSLQAKDMKELVAVLKTKAGTGSFATYSAGTGSHYAGMMLNQKAGLDLQHVPFAGSPPALIQVMAGQIDIMFDGVPTSLPQLRAGKLRAIGVASSARTSFLPNVPTLAEQGYPELDFGNWFGIFVASGVPAATADRIAAETRKAAGTAKFHERLTSAGFDTPPEQTAAQLAASLKADYERNGAIVKTFSIKLNQ
jgi:tripartite-type tricarboxylate transporter receptor subunit TctC